MRNETELLIIGAGPFGLAAAAQASHVDIDHIIIGRPMEFWRNNMPKGMFLRSACDWHLDVQEVDTIERYVAERGQTPAGVEPLSLEFYHSYVEWFQKGKGIEPREEYVTQLGNQSNSRRFVATTTAGDRIQANRVLLAPGFKYFANVPEDLSGKLPPRRFSHTCDFVDFSNAKGKRFLIIGGRQSAFEWAALLIEAGAAEVHLSHRHDSPSFEPSDWSWVNPIVDGIAKNPMWFRKLSQQEKDDVNRRLWAEGRLKVEPWLESRLATDRVKLWPRTEVDGSEKATNGDLSIKLNNGQSLVVDEIVLATGYKVDISKLPYLSSGNLMDQLQTSNGFPRLDQSFQTSVPGLFITSMPATQDFGPFFGFTIAARTSAQIICNALIKSI